MPIVAVRDPITLDSIPIEDAPVRFEDAGIMPADVVALILKDAQDEARLTPHVSPSSINPDTNCRRELFLRRYANYVIDPWKQWAAMEGTLFHRMVAGQAPGWKSEVRVPAEGKIELWPGVEMGGTIDRLRDDGSEIADHKTTKYPWTPKPDAQPRDFARPEEWAIQLNTYRLLVEKARALGLLDVAKPVEELWVWRTYRGSRLDSKTFRKIRVPWMTSEEIWAKCGDFITSLLGWYAEAEAVKAEMTPNTTIYNTLEGKLDEIAGRIPMDGEDKAMFGGKKCTAYCGVNEVCMRIAGRASF